MCGSHPFPLPLSDGKLQVRPTTGFVAYSELHEQAGWVAYELTAKEVAGDVGRTDDFRSEQEIGTGPAPLADYKGSGYDRWPHAKRRKQLESISDILVWYRTQLTGGM